MHNGVIPGSFTANVSGSGPSLRQTSTDDMKSENKRHAPKRKSFLDWLQYRARAEDEESLNWDEEPSDEELDDINDEELDDIDDEDLDDLEYDGMGEPEDLDDLDRSEDDPEEFDDFDEEKELSFDDEDPELDGLSGRFTDFYRMDAEEEEEAIAPQGTISPLAVGGNNKQSAKDQARTLFQQLTQQQDIDRDQIIQEFVKQLGITEQTAISYYEDLSREMGSMDSQEMEDPSMDDDEGPIDELPGDTEMELSQEEIDSQDPNAQGIIRAVNNAHLVYKRQLENGSFEELWIYNLSDNLKDALQIRREILDGTDIPRGHTRSENGDQTYTLQTMGNAQLLHISGMSN